MAGIVERIEGRVESVCKNDAELAKIPPFPPSREPSNRNLPAVREGYDEIDAYIKQRRNELAPQSGSDCGSSSGDFIVTNLLAESR